MIFEIPIPPSANNLWRYDRGRVHRSDVYSRWLVDASLQIPPLTLGAPPYRVAINIRSGAGFPKDRDIDNCAKPCLDLMKYRGLIPDDAVKYVTEVCVRYIERGRGPKHYRHASCFIDITSAQADPDCGSGEVATSTKGEH